MTKRQDPRVGLDSQCLSYLLDAISGTAEPTDTLVDEKKALIRNWFYTPITYYTSETVVSEATAIENPTRRDLHEDFLQVLFVRLPVQDRTSVGSRTNELMAIHSKVNDCRIVAEAEDQRLDVLLTYDRRLLNRLGQASKIVRITKPGSYWSSLNIPRGAPLITAPHDTNPLSKQTWWRWE